jgi:hypothetical protein
MYTCYKSAREKKYNQGNLYTYFQSHPKLINLFNLVSNISYICQFSNYSKPILHSFKTRLDPGLEPGWVKEKIGEEKTRCDPANPSG